MAHARPPFRNLVLTAIIHTIIGYTLFVGAKDDTSFLRDSFHKRTTNTASTPWTTSLITSAVVCPDGQNPIIGNASTCNRMGDSCEIHNQIGFCHTAVVSQESEDVSTVVCCPKCPNTASPLSMAALPVCETTKDCPAGFVCTSRDASGSILFTESVCCPSISRALQEDDQDEEDDSDSEEDDEDDEDDNPSINNPAAPVPIKCPDGQNPFPGNTNCGLGGVQCETVHGNDAFCYIHPADAFAVCCPKCSNGATGLSFCNSTITCPVGSVCTSRDESGTIPFAQSVCCPESDDDNGSLQTNNPQLPPAPVLIPPPTPTGPPPTPAPILSMSPTVPTSNDETSTPQVPTRIPSPQTLDPSENPTSTPQSPDSITVQCPDGQNPLPGNTFCGRGGVPCETVHGNDAFCHIDPTDRFAVCCPKCPNAVTSLSICKNTTDCSSGSVCLSQDASGRFSFTDSVCCPGNSSVGSSGDEPTDTPQVTPSVASSSPLPPTAAGGDGTPDLNEPDDFQIQCPFGQSPLPGNTFCGRGGTPCESLHGNDAFCYIDPRDRFAVCCPKCPGGDTGLSTCATTDDCPTNTVCTSRDFSGGFTFEIPVCCPPTETESANAFSSSWIPLSYGCKWMISSTLLFVLLLGIN